MLSVTRVALLALIFSAALSAPHSASGQLVGTVCIAPSGVNQCPAPPTTVTGAVGSQLRVSISIQSSDTLSSFDITLKANSSILKAVDADISGSILSGGSTILKCIGGALKQGPVCSSTDTIDTIHLAITGPLGFFTIAPTTGLLFTAVYNVTSSSSTSVGFQTGCSPSSVANSSSCVNIANGTILPVPETTQAATYTQAPTPSITITVDLADVAVGKRSAAIVTLTATSVNGFAGTLSLSSSLSPSTKHPPSVVFSPSSVTLSAGSSATSSVTITATANTTQGTYVVNVIGQSGTLSESLQINLAIIT